MCFRLLTSVPIGSQIFGGVSGRHAGWMSRHGHILEFGAAQLATCPESGFEYELRDGNVRCLSLDEGTLLPVELS